jgi:hypothetical protein
MENTILGQSAAVNIVVGQRSIWKEGGHDCHDDIPNLSLKMPIWRR